MDVGVGHLVACNADESSSREWVVEDDEENGDGLVVFGWEWRIIGCRVRCVRSW